MSKPSRGEHKKDYTRKLSKKSHKMYMDKKKDTTKEKDVYVGAFFQTCKVKEMEIDFDYVGFDEWKWFSGNIQSTNLWKG